MMPTIFPDSSRPERSKTVEKPGVGIGPTHQQFILFKASGIPCYRLPGSVQVLRVLLLRAVQEALQTPPLAVAPIAKEDDMRWNPE